MTRALIACLGIMMSGTAFAQSWDEQIDGGGDAGDFPAPDGFQNTFGVGPLSNITGKINFLPESTQIRDDWVDAYCITVTDAEEFYATTDPHQDPSAGGFLDSRLWLFDLEGNLVMGNNDSPTNWFKSLLTDPGSYPGDVFDNPGSLVEGQKYILAIAGFDNDPEDAAGQNLATLGISDALWGPNPEAGSFDHWENGFFDGFGDYSIALNGATYSVPAPGSIAALAGVGLMATRRRRA